MTTYTVKYRPNGSFIWRTIKNVKGDAFIPNTSIIQFIQADETLTEINIALFEIQYSKERHTSILENMSREAGQQIK